MTLGDALCLFHDVQCVCQQELLGQPAHFDQPGDNIDGVERQLKREDAVKVLCYYRILSQFEQENYCHIGVVFDEGSQVLRQNSEVQDSIRLILKTPFNLVALFLGQTLFEALL